MVNFDYSKWNWVNYPISITRYDLATDMFYLGDHRITVHGLFICLRTGWLIIPDDDLIMLRLQFGHIDQELKEMTGSLFP